MDNKPASVCFFKLKLAFYLNEFGSGDREENERKKWE